MRIVLFTTALLIAFTGYSEAIALGLPVKSGHPRIMITPEIKTALQAKVSANDPRWTRLKELADELSTYGIHPYKWATRTDAPENKIYYTYQGEGWYYTAMPLALAYHMTGDTKYSNKLFELIDEMQRAQTDPENTPPTGFGPLVPDNYYSTRNLCPVLAVAYDWCFDALTPARKQTILNLMRTYYNELKDSAYQRNDHADGNYYVGHMFGVAMMGYASFGDNTQAQEMIDWARIRFDGGTSPNVAAEHTPEDFFAQLFEGGTRPQPAREYNGPTISGAPHKGGTHLQGWAYGAATYNWIIDYVVTVKAATNEDLIAQHTSWWSQMLRALKSGLHPNKFEIDNSGDYGGDYGAVIFHSLPIRLAHVLAGTNDGAGAQNFAYSEIAKNSPYPNEFPDDIYQMVFLPQAWEDFYYADLTRPAQELQIPPFYSGFGPVYPQGGTTNGAMPFFYARSDWSVNATWTSVRQGAAWYDDHQHADAGTFQIKHANDYLLVDATNWKGDLGSIGIVGSSQNAQYNAGAGANTLFFDDYGTYLFDPQVDSRFCGGQGLYGRDIIAAAEQTLDYTYVRSDLSSAYTNTADTTDLTPPTLDYFYRTIAYLPKVDVFVVLDQTQHRASSSPRGEFRKHMRWHIPNTPTIAGTKASVTHGQSRLDIDVLLPENASVVAVDERQNPDPCDGTDPNCVPYGFNCGTYRIEVSDPAKSRTTPFLTVLHPSFSNQPSVLPTMVTSQGNTMRGTRIVHASKGQYVMMFNNGSGHVPTPISEVTYSMPNPDQSFHVLAGMLPSTKYNVQFTPGNVEVRQNASGAYTSSAAGILTFGTAVVGVSEESNNGSLITSAVVSPNPVSSTSRLQFETPVTQELTVEIVDALGNLVATIAQGVFERGEHHVSINANDLSTGSYTCIVRSSKSMIAQRCLVVK